MKCDRCSHFNEPAARYCSSCGSELAINLVGTVLGDRYRVLSFIGSGGMGRVYRAEHIVLERPAAVKVLAPEYARDQKMLERFYLEATAAGRACHPNIAATYDYGHKDQLVYSVMEYVDGTPLDNVVLPLDFMRALEIARQIAQALGAAHDQGVVHRDVKPGNVMVCQLGDRDFIKVVDFGLAVLRVDQHDRPITGPGLTMGTPAYVSPEQVLGEEIDARADVYSLGAVLYEMIVGQPPFGYGDAASLSVSHAYKVPPRPSSYSPLTDIPEEVDDFVMRMLAKDPDQRPENGAAVATELTQLLGQVSSIVPALTQNERSVCVARFDSFEDIDDVVQRDVIQVVTAMGGKMARSVGDEFISYFDSATGAVAAAARLAASSGCSPAVAVHWGVVELGASGGVFGKVVNVALRMARLAAPGEALASKEICVKLDDSLRTCLSEGGRLRLGGRTPSVEIYRVTGFESDTGADHPPVVIGEVSGKSTVAFNCGCGYRGVIVAGKLRAGKAIRVRCNGCARQLSVVPISRTSLRDTNVNPDEDALDSQITNKIPEIANPMPEMSDQLITDPPPEPHDPSQDRRTPGDKRLANSPPTSSVKVSD
ncbi:MAG: protein kinase [Proteobacteria bacterium]|nr:protein kinase [Pseudomonadota bacterium]